MLINIIILLRILYQSHIISFTSFSIALIISKHFPSFFHLVLLDF